MSDSLTIIRRLTTMLISGSNKESDTINLHKEFNNTKMVFYVAQPICVVVCVALSSFLPSFLSLWIFLLFTLRRRFCLSRFSLSSSIGLFLHSYFRLCIRSYALYNVCVCAYFSIRSLLLVKTLANLFICLLVENFKCGKRGRWKWRWRWRETLSEKK